MKRTKPTEAELEILNVLWTRGPSTVRQVHEELEEQRPVGPTTVLKLMQIMTDKGLLERDASVRPQVFRTARSAQQTQRQLVRDLADRAFGGSPSHLVLQALAGQRTTAEDRARIREMLEQLEAQGGEGHA